MIHNNVRFRTCQVVSPPVGKPGLNGPITGERDAMETKGLVNDRRQLEQRGDQSEEKQTAERKGTEKRGSRGRE